MSGKVENAVTWETDSLTEDFWFSCVVSSRELPLQCSQLELIYRLSFTQNADTLPPRQWRKGFAWHGSQPSHESYPLAASTITSDSVEDGLPVSEMKTDQLGGLP